MRRLNDILKNMNKPIRQESGVFRKVSMAEGDEKQGPSPSCNLTPLRTFSLSRAQEADSDPIQSTQAG